MLKGNQPPFWEQKTLEQMSSEEWEALCDGCGRCCLVKLEDEDTGVIVTARAHCRLFDNAQCRCSDYANRQAKVPDCAKITPHNIGQLGWMPKSCAYRRLHEGRELAWWHPLVSGSKETVFEAGISMRGQTVCETQVDPDNWEKMVDADFDEMISEKG